MASFENSLGEWWMPSGETDAFIEGYKALYAMDEGVYLENPYESDTQENTDWYGGFMTALAAHWCRGGR